MGHSITRVKKEDQLLLGNQADRNHFAKYNTEKEINYTWIALTLQVSIFDFIPAQVASN